MKYRKLISVILATVMSVSLLAGCHEDTAEGGESSVSTSAPETTTAAPVETTTTAAPVVEEPDLQVAVGEIQNIFNPAFAEADGDREVNGLVHVPLLTIDRNGEVLYSASESAVSDYRNVDYTYQGIADVEASYDATADITTFTIRLKQGVTFSDGEELTADDVIFTYYVLCDDSYDGPSGVKNQIVGVEAYQKNNSAAPGVTVTSEEISKALGEPTEALKQAIIDQITRPVLEEEKAWCRDNWQKYVERGYGDSAEEFFITLYTSTVDAEYDMSGKTFDDIVDDTVNMFGMNYKALAKNYQGDIDFFDAQVEEITENQLYQAKLDAAGGVAVPSIQGIRKIDEYTLEIDSVGNDAQKIYSVCNIRIIPLHYYGDDSMFDVAANTFGFTRGDLTGVKSKSAVPLGAGPFKYVSGEDGAVILAVNEKYFAGNADSFEMKLVPMASEARLDAVISGDVDMAEIPYDKAAEAAIQSANSEGTLSGDTVAAQLFDLSGYYYFGLNAARLRIGEDSNSEQSIALRRALAVLMTADRENIGANYMGSSAKVIDLPFSEASWASSGAYDDNTSAVYLTDAEGNAIYTEGQTSEERLAAARQAAISYFVSAGYVFSEEEDKIMSAPEGGKLEFSAVVPYYFSGDTAMMSIMNQIKSVMESLGLTLTIEEAADINEFGYALSEQAYDFWCGERSTFIEPQSYKYYHSSGTNNFYGLSLAELDALIEASRLSYVFEERAQTYQSIFNMILDSGVEVPAYQRQGAVVYRTDKIQADSIPVISEFFDWMDGMPELVLEETE